MWAKLPLGLCRFDLNFSRKDTCSLAPNRHDLRALMSISKHCGCLTHGRLDLRHFEPSKMHDTLLQGPYIVSIEWNYYLNPYKNTVTRYSILCSHAAGISNSCTVVCIPVRQLYSDCWYYNSCKCNHWNYCSIQFWEVVVSHS